MFMYVYLFVSSKPLVVLDEQSCVLVEQHLVLLRNTHQPYCCFLLPV